MRWIAEVLIAKGISPHREPRLWTEVGIRYILTNEKYIGDSLCQKSYTCGFPFVRKKNCGEQKLPTHKDNISNYRSSSIEKTTDSELFRVSGFSLKTRLHSGTIYVYKRNFS